MLPFLLHRFFDVNHLPGAHFGASPFAWSLEPPSPRPARPTARRSRSRRVFRHLSIRWRFLPHSLGRRVDLRHHSKHLRWHACSASIHPPKPPFCPWVLCCWTVGNAVIYSNCIVSMSISIYFPRFLPICENKHVNLENNYYCWWFRNPAPLYKTLKITG